MIEDPVYARETRANRFSLAALSSLLLGLAVAPDLAVVYTRLYAITNSIPLQWVMLIQAFVVPVAGLACGIVAVAQRRRLWWLGLIGLILNALAMVFLLLSLAKTIFPRKFSELP